MITNKNANVLRLYFTSSVLILLVFSSASLVSGISSTETLFYGEYFYLESDDTLSRWSSISWSFTKTNPSITITVVALSESNFQKFADGFIYFGHTLSDVSDDKRSGTFDIPDLQEESKWYIVFWHNDIDGILETTSVTGSIEVNGPLLTLLSIIIPVVLVVVIMLVIFILVNRSKRRRKKM
ncbi:MAG: hypothetical protein FK733_12435 [Asgard group archaeon]|nr:hypothetical protein [Asgard group archaeon]